MKSTAEDPAENQNPLKPLLWAKTSENWGNKDRSDRRYHPLLCHMLDVAAVAGLVWDHWLALPLRERIKCSLGSAARDQVVFWAGTHDVGKASPGFQKKVPELSRHSGLQFSQNDNDLPHGKISAHVLKEVLGPSPASILLGQVTGGHHGIFPRSGDLRVGRDTLGNNSWKKSRQQLLQEFANTVGLDLNRAAKSMTAITDPAIVPILAGLISVSDWIGSNQEFFPCVARYGTFVEISATKYWSTAKSQARNALEKLGWLPAVTVADEAGFNDVFRDLVPNALQTATIKLASEQISPYLMIVEAPMGQGKTETALYAADVAMCRGMARGMYIAMPTQATSNAMFKRVLDDYLRTRGHQGKLNLQLVHGDALLAQMAEVQEGEIPEFSPNNIGDEGDVEAQSWFTAKKRPLLAPFGVGSVDQVLLSVLQTKHWFVRLFGLAGKVLIFDEVHAYDTYMNTILERLLRWLAELDCTVILLSATLPEDKRKALAKAYSGREDIDCKPYPRITLVRSRQYPNQQSDSSPESVEIPIEEQRSVKISFAKTDLSTTAATLNQQLGHGGCAAVICNTVDRSIEVYNSLRENLTNTECLLFHARTLQMWRSEREQEVLLKFGKGERQKDGTYVNQHRPERSVLVATQVVEQSLDLDFDLMISEIAPIDLLLQRCGRLHRHKRRRPVALEIPQFIVLCDSEVTGSLPGSFGKSIESIYDRYLLLRTWLALHCRKSLEIPSEIEPLIEAVYGELGLGCQESSVEVLRESRDKMESKHSESAKAAVRLLVCQPKFPCDLIEEFNDQLADEEDPQVSKTVRAATREGHPSITVVMLPEEEVLIPDPNISEVRSLLRRSAKVSHPGIFRLLTNDSKSPREWAKNAHLLHARLLRLDGNKQTHVGDYVLTVDKKNGVMIERDGDNNG